MHINKVFIIFIFLIQSLQAQVTPEVCARLLVGLGQDSITWQATPCTGFGGYVLLGQANNSGPFIPLDTIMSTNVAHSNPGEIPWNYKVGMICSGVLTNFSFAVSNLRPITPDIQSVNIIGNSPVVSWDPSPSPEVIGYQLYKESPYGSGNFFPYPSSNSIINATSFNDISAASLLARYAIVAVSPCNKSLLGVGNAIDGTTGPHTSMILSGVIDTCKQEILFNWNGYENWKDGVQHYEIWVNRNGIGYILYDTIPQTSNSYLFQNAQDNDLLSFQIKAIENNKSNSAVSNELTFDIRVNRPMDFIHILKLTVTATNEVEIQWDWDTDVDFVNGTIHRGSNSNSMSSIFVLNSIGSSPNTYSDVGAAPDQNSVFYRISSLDACGFTVKSNLVETISLKTEAQEGFINKISWNIAVFEHGTVLEYQVYKIINNTPQLIATLPATELSYFDDLDVLNQAEAHSCYFVIATLSLNLPGGLTQIALSQSNKSCVKQMSNVHIPNAVSPNGKNRHFRPLIVFSNSISNYSMIIYDRYGQQIFQSTNPYRAWDGTKNGKAIKMGVYVYVIRFIQPNGEWLERKGTVMLVR
ncbi:MAG: gliding motility-associated C-terminal domain-containing protein [Saprospiraceae bacterium]|nr:gliding motility-associated C-terminal domain-containing protein [Saprospiraceae bacterium]